MTSLLHLQGKFVGRGPRAVFLKKHICSGGQGSVFEALVSPGYTRSEDACAVKVIRKANMTPERRSQILQEFLIHQSVSSHRNVVTCRDFFDDGGVIFGVLDFVRGGDLHYAISEKAIFWQDSNLLRDVFRQIVDAVSFCHSKRISHLDLKPENVLCSSDCHRVYLTDFGVATPSLLSQQFNVGTTMYMAPEVMDSGHKLGCYDTRRADIWSLGCIFVNMIGGEIPWYEARLYDENYAAFLTQPDFLRDMLPISAEADVLARRILEPSARERVSLRTLGEEIYDVQTFFMDAQQIKHSTDSVRGIALLAASTKHDWSLRVAQQSASATKSPTPVMPDIGRLGLSSPASTHPPSLQQHTTRQCLTTADALEDASEDSLFCASESFADLASLCSDDFDHGVVEDEDEAADYDACGFDDVLLQSPIAPSETQSPWMTRIPGARLVIPALASGALSAASTVAPSTPLEASFAAHLSPRDKLSIMSPKTSCTWLDPDNTYTPSAALRSFLALAGQPEVSAMASASIC
ncbi:kinase-like protein [Peniophora sp. CONT]|nr:kinase-like protein [Peniophora sp. CONT]